MSFFNSLDFVKYLVLKLGVSVFPVYSINPKTPGVCSCKKKEQCMAPGKHPVVYDRKKGKSWRAQSTKDVDLINLWLGKGYNLGVACGAQDNERNLVVVDIDVENHTLLDVFKSVDTFGYKTGRGGYHFWFLSKEKVKNSVSQVAVNIDIRGEGGYVIVPPSNHHSGGVYTPFVDWETKDIKATPDWLCEILGGNDIEFVDEQTWSIKPRNDGEARESLISGVVRGWRKGDATVAEIRKKVLEDGEKAPFGARHDLVFRLASSDRGRGEIVTYAQVKARVEQYNTTEWLVEPLEEGEIKTIIGSIMKFKVFNTDYRKVNQTYVRWALIHDKTWDMPKDWAEQLDGLDNEFFEDFRGALLRRYSDDPTFKGVSIVEVMEKRNEWYAHRGITKHAKFSIPLFAKKLETVGYVKKRYTRAALWKAKEGWTPELQEAIETKKDIASDELIAEAKKEGFETLRVPMTVKVVEDKLTGSPHVLKVASNRPRKPKGIAKKTASNNCRRTAKHRRYLIPVSQTTELLASARFITEVVNPWISLQALKPRLERVPKKKLLKKIKEVNDEPLNRF